MGKVRMDQTAGEKAVPLFLPGYSWRIKDQVIYNLLIRKASYRNQGGYNNYNDSYRKLHENQIIFNKIPKSDITYGDIFHCAK